MSREQDERTLSTADFAAATEAPRAREVREVREARGTTDADRMQQERMQQDQSMRGTAGGGSAQAEPLAELFPQDLAEGFRSRWDAVQIGFVDDPKQAVKQADELVAQVMKSLAESFSRQRSSIEGDVGGADQASTENLRVALQRYRSFFQRLLSL
jgi:hypothetical protein